MDRSSRRTAPRRPPYANSTSPPPSAAESPFARQSSVSPVLKSHSWHQTSQQPPSHPGRRISRPSSHHEFTFSTPDGHRDSLSRKRSRGADGFPEFPAAATPSDADPDGPTKGGHSLRKRARVNYASEQIEDEVTVPNSSSASRQKRRRPDGNHDDSSEDLYGSQSRRQGASLGMETPSGRRRNPSRKSTESRLYVEEFDRDDHEVQRAMEDEVHDTIQVGTWTSASSSPSSKSDSRDVVTHEFDSPEHSRASQNQLDADRSAEIPSKDGDTKDNNNNSAGPNNSATEPAIEPTKDQVQDTNTDPSQQLQVESIDSQKHVDGEAVEPVSTALSPRSPGVGSKSPPRTPNHRQKSPSIKHSPNTIHEGSPMAVDSKEGVAQEPRLSTPLPAGPKLPSSEESATVQDETATSKKQPDAPNSSPKHSSKESSVSKSPADEDMAKDSEEYTPIKEGSLVNSIEPTKPIEAPPTEPEKPKSDVIEIKEPVKEPVSGTPLKEEQSADKSAPPLDPRWCRPQPTPVGRWSHLTPYVDGQFSVYPEKKVRSEEDDVSEYQSPEDKDATKENNDMDAIADDNDDGPDGMTTELPTPALNTPTRGSPVPETLELTGLNSPVPVVEEVEDPDVSESQEPLDRKKHYRYRKLRDPEEFAAAIENYEDMPTAELYGALQAINLSLVGWQEEWTALGKIVDDYENASRRRIADAKYETRTRNLNQHGINYEEPEFAVRGYKAKERETMSETRYLQAQDRIMAAAYGFEYDPHPSKIGRQNPETQQAGVTTRGRSLRNQPRQTAKATEADGVTGKRQRKPVQLYDPAPQDISRASSPVPTRGRRRKTANADNEDAQPSFTSSFNDISDGEIPPGPGRRKRGPKPRAARIADDFPPTNGTTPEDTFKSSARRGRPKAAPKDEENGPSQRAMDVEPRSEPQKRRHLLTLKIPKGRNLSEPSSAITDNGDSRPSTASSDSTSHTAESSYSFRPKRQKRFRDEPEENGTTFNSPPKKRNRRTGPAEDGDAVMTAAEPVTQAVPQTNGGTKKGPKIKVMRPATGPPPQSRNGTPMSQPTAEGTEEQPKEYRAMTKSEKMSASMKSRWANGNMAGAVEKRKATLAAKKAAQAAAEQRANRAERNLRLSLERIRRLCRPIRHLIPIFTLILILTLTPMPTILLHLHLHLINLIPTLTILMRMSTILIALTMSTLAWAPHSIRLDTAKTLHSKASTSASHLYRVP
ncbi:hypothetical protein ACO1O0_004036 [Amphichorda felina]